MEGKLPVARLSTQPFKVVSPYEPAGDQPKAIEQLARNIESGMRYETLLGVTGSGKTCTMAKTIEAVQKPTLVLAPNKTLAAQLAAELKEFFPNNAVVYFVSYYDYYQPEAYVPTTDTFIEKDASINEEVEKLRHAATSQLLSRRDVIVVASVSCIYGIGSPMDYAGMAVFLDKEVEQDRDELIRKLIDIQYDRNDYELKRGTFRVRGDALDVFPPYADNPIRVEFWGDEIEEISEIDNVTGEVLNTFEALPVWPASHYVAARPALERAVKTIQDELQDRLTQFNEEGKLLEAQRLEMRTSYDLEMIETMGFCSGIENYSRHLDGREPGEPPYTLIDYFPTDFLCFIDESHVTVPQIRGMHEGDRSRKITLIERETDAGWKRTLHLGTGNYHDSTAKLYTDFGLLTADEALCRDGAAFFEMLRGSENAGAEMEELIHAPENLQTTILQLIDRERENAEAGIHASIIAKMNSLCDVPVMEALCDAGRAGVEIHLIVRGICSLLPGKKHGSENVHVHSIVGRHLEHARAFVFENGGDREVYLSSADWMPRNLYRRVELMFPVKDECCRRAVENVLRLQLMDNEKCRVRLPGGAYVLPELNGAEEINAQEIMLRDIDGVFDGTALTKVRAEAPAETAEGQAEE